LKNFAFPNNLHDAEAKLRSVSSKFMIDDPYLLKIFSIYRMDIHGNICQLTGKGVANG
jgi:hypothetical protein